MARNCKGIVTNRDLRFETDFDRPVYEVMTKDSLVTAPEGITLEASKGCCTNTASKNFWSWMKKAGSRA